MFVRDVMKNDVVTVSPGDSLSATAKVMGENRIGCVVVAEGGKVIGILTERDILLKIVAPCRDAKKAKVKDVMASPVRTVSPDEDLEDAATIMSELNVKHLPVVKNKKLVGIVTSADIVSILPEVSRSLMNLEKEHKI